MSRILFFQLSPRIFASAIFASGFVSVSDNKKSNGPSLTLPNNNNNKSVPSGQAIDLISFEQDGTIKFNKTGLKSILESVKDLPVIVYSVNGNARTGKSYILNHVARYLHYHQGQEVTSSPHKTMNPILDRPQFLPETTTTEESLPSTTLKTNDWFTADPSLLNLFYWETGLVPITKGIKIWSEPFIVTKEGKKYAVLLLDCQGIPEDYIYLWSKENGKQARRETSIVMALSDLLSSVSIYNVHEKIDTNLLEYVLFSTEFSRSLNPGEKNLGHRIIFLVRDVDPKVLVCNFATDNRAVYPFGYHDKNTPKAKKIIHVANYYRDFFLSNVRWLDDHIKLSINPKFDDIAVYLMPEPGKSFVDKPTSAPPNPQFNSEIQYFVKFLISKEETMPKIIKGMEMTGQDMMEHFELLSTMFTRSKPIPFVEPYTEAMSKFLDEKKMKNSE